MWNKDTLKAAIEAAKKLKLSVLDLIPAFAVLASGGGLVKTAISAIKWTAFSAAVPFVSQIGVVLYGVASAIKSIAKETGSLDAAIARISMIKGLEHVFAPLLGGTKEAKERVAELVQFTNNSPFQIKGVAEANKALQVLTSGELATQSGMKQIGDVAAATGNGIEDVAGQVGMFYNKLKRGEDITATSAELQSMGVISEKTARDIQSLQSSGAGFSQIWAKLDQDMQKSRGGMAAMSNEIGTLQGKLEKSREALAIAFGKPFIDAEKTGIKNTIQALDNLRPAVAAIGNTLSTVSGGVDNIKGKFLVWATSMPRLGEVVGIATKALVVMGGVISGIGAVQAIRRFGDVKAAIEAMRAAIPGLKPLADSLVAGADKARILAESLRAAAKSAAGMGVKSAVPGLEKQAKAAATKAVLKDTGAAMLGDVGAAGRVASSGWKALGGLLARAIVNPWVLATTAIAGTAAAAWQLNETQKAIRKSVDDSNKAHRETLHILDEQIRTITTLDDKQRALNATTSALISVRSKLAAAKLPTDENRLTMMQKLYNSSVSVFAIMTKLERLAGIPIKVPEKLESKGKVEAKTLKAQAKELEAREEALNRTKGLVSERELERVGKRALLEREIKDIHLEGQLSTAPDAASQEVILRKQQNEFKARAATGEKEEAGQIASEKAIALIADKQRKVQAKVVEAASTLEELGETNKGAAERNVKESQQVTKILTREGSTATHESATITADRDRLGQVKERILGEQGRAARAGSHTGNTRELESLEAEARAIEKRIANEEQVIRLRKEQNDELLKSTSELNRINGVIEALQTPGRKVTFEGFTPKTPEERSRLRTDLERRRVPLEQDVKEKEANKVKVEEVEQRIKQTVIEKRKEAPNIEAEKEILEVKGEGIDREEQLSVINRTRLNSELDIVRQINAEERKTGGGSADIENTREVLDLKKELVEQDRADIALANQKQDLEFQRRAIAIEVTKGRGPDEDIRALRQQLVLNRELTVVTKQRIAARQLGGAEGARDLTNLAVQRTELRRSIEDIKFAKDQSAEAAASETKQLDLSIRGYDHLAKIETDRLDTVQRIAAAIRDGNDALAEQALLQGKQKAALVLGQATIPEFGESNQDFAARKKLAEDIGQRQAVQSASGTAQIEDARNREARGARLNERADATIALRAVQSEEKAQADNKRKQRLEKERQAREEAQLQEDIANIPELKEAIAKKEQIKGGKLTSEELAQVKEAVEDKSIETAAKAKVEGKQTAEQEKKIEIAAEPFRTALDSSSVLKQIEANTRGQPVVTKPQPVEKPGEPIVQPHPEPPQPVAPGAAEVKPTEAAKPIEQPAAPQTAPKSEMTPEEMEKTRQKYGPPPTTLPEISPESIDTYWGVPVKQKELKEHRAEYSASTGHKGTGEIFIDPKKTKEYYEKAKALSDKGLDWRTKELGGKPGQPLPPEEAEQSKLITSSLSNFTRSTLEHEMVHKEHPDWEHSKVESEAWKRTAESIKTGRKTAQPKPEPEEAPAKTPEPTGEATATGVVVKEADIFGARTPTLDQGMPRTPMMDTRQSRRPLELTQPHDWSSNEKFFHPKEYAERMKDYEGPDIEDTGQMSEAHHHVGPEEPGKHYDMAGRPIEPGKAGEAFRSDTRPSKEFQEAFHPSSGIDQTLDLQKRLTPPPPPIPLGGLTGTALDRPAYHQVESKPTNLNEEFEKDRKPAQQDQPQPWQGDRDSLSRPAYDQTPAQPAQPAGGDGKGGGDMSEVVSALNEIKAKMEQIGSKIGVA